MTVRPVVPAEFDVVLAVCVEAFADEAVSAWVEPVAERRLDRTRELFTTSLRAAVDAGQLLVACTPGGEPVAASMWITLDGARSVAGPEDHADPTGPADPADRTGPAGPTDPAGLAGLAGPTGPSDDHSVSRRLAAVVAATTARHPGAPHVYLSAMAALRRRRGLGAGSAMLRHGLDQARELGLPVYLEASTPQNQRLYSRHGFQEHGAPIRLPEAGPTLQPMWHPNGRTAP
ncbi:GNAT family N-acetyltransferase [Promicromonospora sp. MEB111]|uniref:GNAT family N-acetyltransferase n=1 Tax=Promicromonospora sp. MEB111 TaxID=3040301 RepID=UPI00254C8A03|nr:GNAT family N-acetyltransferase [Promicromonospora sp. MEB111]